jgi:hypothetical protein
MGVLWFLYRGWFLQKGWGERLAALGALDSNAPSRGDHFPEGATTGADLFFGCLHGVIQRGGYTRRKYAYP